jgi:hypothetical protein
MAIDSMNPWKRMNVAGGAVFPTPNEFAQVLRAFHARLRRKKQDVPDAARRRAQASDGPIRPTRRVLSAKSAARCCKFRTEPVRPARPGAPYELSLNGKKPI